MTLMKDEGRWPATRTAALARLNDFLPHAGAEYARRRNYDHGPDNRGHVSCLSPWLRYRLLTEHEVISTVLDKHSYSAAEKFIQEVFWRIYFKGWLEHHPDLWPQYRRQSTALQRQADNDTKLNLRLQQAQTANTGIGCFDHWVNELRDHGYLHNHARMWFASIWIFTLRLPWQLGADFFLRHLLDGDAASNTLSWRWVAGLHTRGKHYLASSKNIARYTDGRFPETPGLVTTASALEETHPPVTYTPDAAEPDAPCLTADNHYGLLLLDDDLHPESLPLQTAPKAILALSTPLADPDEFRSPAVWQFGQQAIEHTCQRSSAHWQVAAEHRCTSLWAQTIVDWAREHQLQLIVHARIPQGANRERWQNCQPELTQAGLQTTVLQRPIERLAWPHAKRGFYKLRRQIPDIIDRLGMSQAGPVP